MKTVSHFALLLFSLFIITSCKQEGCTDPRANNFSYEAEKDDGSCDYGGCTDKNALNYNPDAQTDNGSCKYNGGLHIITTNSDLQTSNIALSVAINGSFIGFLNRNCTTQFPTCETACAHLKFTDQAEGFYSLTYFKLRQRTSTIYDTLFTSPSISVKVTGGKCEVFTID